MYSLQLKSFKVGPIAVDGGMSTVLASPGEIRENTLKVTPGGATKTNFYAEGGSSPAIVTQKKGITDIAFDLLTFDPEVIADLIGGTVTGTAPNKIWSEDIGTPIIERSIQVIDSKDNVWGFPRVSLSGGLFGVFTSTDVNVVRISGTLLQPTKAGLAPSSFGKPV